MASTHFSPDGSARMVDVSEKSVTRRVAKATAIVAMSHAAVRQIQDASAKKGDVLGIARIAGINATKWTAMLIPLCHAIPIEQATIDFSWIKPAEGGPSHVSPSSEAISVQSQHLSGGAEDGPEMLKITALTTTTGKTGVEMEAYTAACVAALTVVDMLKSVDRSIEVRNIQLDHKSGGQSGSFQRS
ncbi:MAG: cyclic pyranopterin monophosphate synthase MoaC [Planctomycetota bacterium]